MAITVFFNDDATEEQKKEIGEQLESRDDVSEVKYVSAGDGIGQNSRKIILESNPWNLQKVLRM